MKKKTKRNPIYIPNSYERDFIGIDFNGKSMKERNKNSIQTCFNKEIK